MYDFISNCMTSGRVKTIKTVKRSVIAKSWGWVWIDRTKRLFRAVKTLCMILLRWINMDELLCTFVQTHRRWTPRADCNANCKLWVTMMSQCRFIMCNSCPLWGILILGLWCIVGAGGTQEAAVPSPHIYRESKAALWEFPYGPVVRTPNLHCWGPGFHCWSGN